jgi:hypothetical protein
MSAAARRKDAKGLVNKARTIYIGQATWDYLESHDREIATKFGFTYPPSRAVGVSEVVRLILDDFVKRAQDDKEAQ